MLGLFIVSTSLIFYSLPRINSFVKPITSSSFGALHHKQKSYYCKSTRLSMSSQRSGEGIDELTHFRDVTILSFGRDHISCLKSSSKTTQNSSEKSPEVTKPQTLSNVTSVPLDGQRIAQSYSKKALRRINLPKPANRYVRQPISPRLALLQIWLRQLSRQAGSLIDGTLPGDWGFDPWGIARTRKRLDRLREIELKHARLAMLGAIGWPLSELFNEPLMKIFRLPSQLAPSGQAPTVINGGLLTGPNAVALGLFAVIISALEYYVFTTRKSLRGIKKEYEPGEFGFDPLNLYEFSGTSPAAKFTRREEELLNGRIAMMALTSYVYVELSSGAAVVDITPIFFRPIWDLIN